MIFSFNHQLLSELSSNLKKTKIEFEATCQLSHSNFHLWMVQKEDFPLEALIRLCNAEHISISQFIIEEGQEYTPYRITDILHQGEWKDIRIDYDGFKAMWKLDTRKVAPIEMVRKMGAKSHRKIAGWVRKGDSTITVKQLCKFCNEFKISPLDIVLDPNTNKEYLFRQDESDKDLYYKKRNAVLCGEIKALQQELKKVSDLYIEERSARISLQNENIQLKRELDILKCQSNASMLVADNGYALDEDERIV